MICFLRPHLLCFSHSSRWLAQGREKETERAEARLGERAAISYKASCSFDTPDWGGTGGVSDGIGVGVKLMEGKAHQSHASTHTHTHMHGHKQSVVMVECICVTGRQVRGLLVTWLRAELCHSYLLWPLTSIPPQPLCALLWCIYVHGNAQATGKKKKLSSVKRNLFRFNDPVQPCNLLSANVVWWHKAWYNPCQPFMKLRITEDDSWLNKKTRKTSVARFISFIGECHLPSCN